MPPVTETELDWARKEFGSISSVEVGRWLIERGFILTDDWHWKKPSAEFEPSEKDLRAINFLINEYEFGGLV